MRDADRGGGTGAAAGGEVLQQHHQATAMVACHVVPTARTLTWRCCWLGCEQWGEGQIAATVIATVASCTSRGWLQTPL